MNALATGGRRTSAWNWCRRLLRIVEMAPAGAESMAVSWLRSRGRKNPVRRGGRHAKLTRMREGYARD